MNQRRTRRTRSLLLAAVAALGGASPMLVSTAAPAAAGTVLTGLDCGIEGELHAVGDFPPVYTVTAVGTAGPYVVPGTHASIACSLRRESRTGPAITSWGVSSSESVAPAIVPVLVRETIAIGDQIGAIFLCSTVSWRSVNGPQSKTGCELVDPAGVTATEPTDDPWIDVRPLVKPQDADLDDSSRP